MDKINKSNNIRRTSLTGLILIFAVVFSTLAISPVSAETTSTVPTLPCEYSGSVFIGDTPAPAGTIIRAFIGEEEAGRFVVNQAGTYGGEGLFDDRLLVEGDDSVVDQEIIFKIWSNEVNETLLYQPGDSREFDLHITYLEGDFNTNAFVDIGDVSKVSYMVADKIQPEISADFNGNGEVDIGDAAMIAYFFVRKVEFL